MPTEAVQGVCTMGEPPFEWGESVEPGQGLQRWCGFC